MKSIDELDPKFYISDDNKNIIKTIEEKLSLVKFDNDERIRNVKLKSKVRSIHSLLAIEANSLSLEISWKYHW